VYTLEIDGVPISITSDATASDQEINDALVAAINAEPLVNGRVIAAGTAATTFTVTSLFGGLSFTATESDANLTLAQTTANDTADPIPFGALCIYDDPESLGPDRLGRVIDSTAVTGEVVAQVVVLTPEEENDARYFTAVTALGVTYVASYLADASATVQEIVEALTTELNAILPATTVAVTEDDATLILTSEVAGVTFTYSAWALGATGGDAAWVVTSDTASVDLAADLVNMLAGVAIFTYRASPEGLAQYEAGQAVPVLDRGEVYVKTEELVDRTKPVYVGVASTVKGLYRGSAAANYIRIPADKLKWSWAHDATLAVLEVTL
jgi:hypothetical protein